MNPQSNRNGVMGDSIVTNHNKFFIQKIKIAIDTGTTSARYFHNGTKKPVGGEAGK